MRLAGAVALVTGASSGIGSAVSESLAEAGAHVLAHGRDERRTKELAARVGGQALLADLRPASAAVSLADQAMAAHGRVDVLVANAGRGWSGPFVDMTDDEVDDLVSLDLLAAIRLTRRLLPQMTARGSGQIALVSSVAGRTGVAGEAVYAATKAGLDAFADSLRLELAGTGVGVSVVVPAAVRTDFFVRRGRPYDRKFPRPVPPEAVARALVEAIRRDQAERWVPRWARVATVVRAVLPGPYRRLSLRFGEPVRSGRSRPDGRTDPRTV